MWGVLFGFLIGALTVLTAEAVVLLKVLEWLRRKGKFEPPGTNVGRDLDGEQSLACANNKKGVVWLLEEDKVSWVTSDQSASKVLRDQKIRKGILEVSPAKKYARIENQILTLEDTNGSKETSIQLKDCSVMAVSGSNLSSRKWARKYPLKVYSNKSAVYKGSKTFYLFFETSWEKEAWCKALRLASCSDKGKRFGRLTRDFHNYVSLLTAEYPSFVKPSEFAEAADRTSKTDASSKVRYFLKRIAKKAVKGAIENKASTISSSNRGENRFTEKLRSMQDVPSLSGLFKSSSTDKFSNVSTQDLSHHSVPSTSHSGSQSQPSLPFDLASSEKLVIDEGTLCWNLLFSRLFFDAKESADINGSLKERIQRLLSNMRTPSYIGGITCTDLNLGHTPLQIRSMRVLPMDLNDAWAFEIDVEYSGGMSLDIETRLEVREPDFQRGLVDNTLVPSTAEVTSDLLEGLEHYKSQMKCSSDKIDDIDNKRIEERQEVLKPARGTSWTSTYVSRWKAIVQSVADQVSQVPLSLRVRIKSLCGTLRVRIKPPPSDQLWFGFTSMPDIDWNIDSSVGDHKISSVQIAQLIRNRFKAAIQEALVLPNCESVCIPWMLAEKDDWVPRKDAPFIWIKHEVGDDLVDHALSSESGETKDILDNYRVGKSNSVSCIGIQGHFDNKSGVNDAQPGVPVSDFAHVVAAAESAPVCSGSGDRTTVRSVSEDLREPLLNEDAQDDCKASTSDEDAKPKKGRRERFRDLGKRMGEKLEEKKRHLEERSRHIVEKMRENARQ